MQSIIDGNCNDYYFSQLHLPEGNSSSEFVVKLSKVGCSEKLYKAELKDNCNGRLRIQFNMNNCISEKGIFQIDILENQNSKPFYSNQIIIH